MDAARTEARSGELLPSLDLGRKEELVSELSKSPSTKHWALNWAFYKRGFIFSSDNSCGGRSLDFTDGAAEIRLRK